MLLWGVCVVAVLYEVYVLKVKVPKLLVMLVNTYDEVNKLVQKHEPVFEPNDLHVVDVQRKRLPELWDEISKVETVLYLIRMS